MFGRWRVVYYCWKKRQDKNVLQHGYNKGSAYQLSNLHRTARPVAYPDGDVDMAGPNEAGNYALVARKLLEGLSRGDECPERNGNSRGEPATPRKA